jgi:hypothetical protein
MFVFFLGDVVCFGYVSAVLVSPQALGYHVLTIVTPICGPSWCLTEWIPGTRDKKL